VESEEGGRKGGGREFERRFQRFLEREKREECRERKEEGISRDGFGVWTLLWRERARETMATTTTTI
jgi:hypothetical protein